MNRFNKSRFRTRWFQFNFDSIRKKLSLKATEFATVRMLGILYRHKS